MSLVSSIIINLSTYQVPLDLNIQYFLIADSSYTALIYCLYPIAGLLADLKFGRYKTIVSSLWLLVTGAPLLLIGSGLLVTGLQFSIKSMAYIPLIATGGILTGTGLLLLVCSAVAFSANIIQFGLDQLYDSPAEDQIIFIHWYIWIICTTELLSHLLIEICYYIVNIIDTSYYYVIVSLLTAITIILIASMYIAHQKKKWFMLNKKLFNPYKLVYHVTKFAAYISSQPQCLHLL